MPLAPTADPSAEDVALFLGGSRTLSQAEAESGLSRDELWELMRAGTVRFRIKDRRGTRLVAWADVATYVAALPSDAPAPVPHRKLRCARARTP